MLSTASSTRRGLPIGQECLTYFLAFFSARFSFMVLAGFFLVSLRASWLLPMGVLLVIVKCAAFFMVLFGGGMVANLWEKV